MCLHVFTDVCACVRQSMSGVFLDCSPPRTISKSRACPAWPGIPCLYFPSSGIVNGPLHPSNTYMGARDPTLGSHVYAPKALVTGTSPKTLFWPSETHRTVLCSHPTVQEHARASCICLIEAQYPMTDLCLPFPVLSFSMVIDYNGWF